MFGHAGELRRAVYRTTVRIGLGCWMALVLFSCSMVVAMEMVLPGGRFDPQAAHIAMPLFVCMAAFSAIVAVFVLPSAFRYFSATTAPRSPASTGTFLDAVRSTDPYEQAAGRLALLGIAQMIAAAVPALMGFGAFLVGARSSVFGVFVALSVVVLAAALPRPSEWDDSVERAAAESLDTAIENARATEVD